MNKTIKILGTGCPKCKTTTALVNQVIEAEKIDATVEKVEDIMEIMSYNVLSTPAIAINETIVVTGRVPSKSELIDLLR